MTRRIVLLAIMATLGLSTPALADTLFEIIARPTRAYLHEAGSIEVARSAEDLAAIWPGIDIRNPVPVVDFRNRMVVVYFMGPMPDLGSGIDIDDVQVRAGTMILKVLEWDCGGGQMTHAPAIVLTTVRWPGSIVADRRSRGCNF